MTSLLFISAFVSAVCFVQGRESKCVLSAAPPDPKTRCCGYQEFEGRLASDTPAIDQYPWLALVEYHNEGQKPKLLCVGLLISGKYVLTAAQCVTGSALRDGGTPKNVRLGEYDTSNDGVDCVQADGSGEDCADEIKILTIEKTIPHPQYEPARGFNKKKRHDIALIKLKDTAPYTDFIRPICLPSSDITQSAQGRLTLYAAGWGAQNSSNIKHHVALTYVSKEACQPSYNSRRHKVDIWEGHICAGGEGKGTCSGDTGGPLMYDNGKGIEVIGVNSFGVLPCGSNVIAPPDVFTNVHHYIDWIKEQMKE